MKELVIDIGNSDIVLGYWDGENKTPAVYRINTRNITDNINGREAYFEEAFRIMSVAYGTRSIISSVVPSVTQVIKQIIDRIVQTDSYLFDKDIYSKLPLEILKPDEIGTDLVANALAAYGLYHQNCIVIDFGTALSFTTVDLKGKILGVSIAPGIKTALASLIQNAAQLHKVPLKMPDSSLGQNTEHAIQAGILFGYNGLVRGIIDVQEQELGYKLTTIATGGLSHIITPLNSRIDHYEPALTLIGLKEGLQYI